MECSCGLGVIFCSLLLIGVHGSDSDWWEDYMSEDIQKYLSLHSDQQLFDKVLNHDQAHPPFTCSDMSPSPATPLSVHKVKAGDVKIIAALGDSITAGVGINASSITEIANEYRQLSWSIGGFKNYAELITLPNIFRLFNPTLMGYAKGETTHGQPTPLEKTGFNLAVTGAQTNSLPKQIRHLIDTMKSFPRLDFNNDWKVVTILIGSNDLCHYCTNKTLFSADSFIENFKKSLDMLQQELPRAIINVLELFQMKGIRQANDASKGCQNQKVFCPCLINPQDNSAELSELIDQNNQYQNKLRQLVNSGKYDNLDNFAVVVQPLLTKVAPPRDANGNIDYSFFAPDCFHFSIKPHEEMAKGLWNNMFQPEGAKDVIETFAKPLKLICPSQAHPYIQIGRKSVARASSIGLPAFHILLQITIFTLGYA